MYVYMYVCIYVCIAALKIQQSARGMSDRRRFIYNIYNNTYIYIYIYMYVFIVCMYVYMYVYTCV